MAKVFVSYVHEDSTPVVALVRHLKRNGIGVWLDKSELAGGTRWKKKIRDAIQDGLYFLSVHSENRASKERTYASEELLIAIEELRRRPYDNAWLIPIRLDSHPIEDRPIGGGESYLDLHVHDMRDLVEGSRRLLKDLGVDEPVLDEDAGAKGRLAFGGPLGTPHAALKALNGISAKYGARPAERKEVVQLYGEKCLSDLVGLELMEVASPGRVKLAGAFDDLPLALKVAVAKQPSFQVVVSVLNKDFGATGYQIGHEISEFLGKDWSKGSKVRYGNSYRRWAVLFYPNFKKPEEGESGYAWRRIMETENSGHGRKGFITDEVRAEIAKMKAEGLNVPEMAVKLGCVPQVIYNWRRKYPQRWEEL